MSMASHDREATRILRFLAAGAARRENCDRAERVRLVSQRRGEISAGRQALSTLARAALVETRDDEVWLTEVGRAASARLRDGAQNFMAQHGDLATIAMEQPDGVRVVLSNQSESPLAGLARRKGKDGEPFLGDEELAAGERLRRDYTIGLLVPRLGVNWNAAGTAGRMCRSAAGAVELTDAALAARQRVDAALEAVGPELSGLLVDVCCFLKGLEIVESERGWPVRSAKVVLKTALGVLARHYAPRSGRRSGTRILHWGGEGYRPRAGEG